MRRGSSRSMKQRKFEAVHDQNHFVLTLVIRSRRSEWKTKTSTIPDAESLGSRHGGAPRQFRAWAGPRNCFGHGLAPATTEDRTGFKVVGEFSTSRQTKRAAFASAC